MDNFYSFEICQTRYYPQFANVYFKVTTFLVAVEEDATADDNEIDYVPPKKREKEKLKNIMSWKINVRKIKRSFVKSTHQLEVKKYLKGFYTYNQVLF